MTNAITFHPATPEGVRGKNDFFSRELEFPAITTFNAAEIIVNVRYPEFGWAQNVESDMVVRVLTGRLYLFVHSEPEASAQCYSKGETLHIPKGTIYYWVPELPGVLFVVASPPWTKEQQKLLTF